MLHVVDKRFSELADFNRTCYERRLIGDAEKGIFPEALVDDDAAAEAAGESPRKLSFFETIGAAVGSPTGSLAESSRREITGLPEGETALAAVAGLKAW